MRAHIYLRQKFEKYFSGNIKQACEVLNTLMRKNSKKFGSPVSNSQDFVDELNRFFCRFDTVDDKLYCDEFCKNLPAQSAIVIAEDAAGESLSKLKPNKATGPEDLKARLLKASSTKRSFFKGPKSWKFSVLRAIPKKTSAGKPGDFQPIALTSILCKTMKEVLVDLLTTTVASALDPLQFAYKSNRGTDDAVLTLPTLQLTLPKGYVRVLFIDFGAAFNSMKVHILLKRLADLNVDKSLILRIGTQRVCVNGALSGELSISTGSVLSPLLFSLFTNEFAPDRKSVV